MAALGLLVAVLALLLAALVPFSDVALYRTYGAGFPHGRLPAEYPGLSGLLFFLPRLVPEPYGLAFAVLMALVLVAFLHAGLRVRGRPEWTGRFLCYVALGALPVLFSRFDLLPALTVLLAVERARCARWTSAWVWAVIGALFKVFPVLLLPGFLLAERRATGRTPWRRVGAVGAVVGAVGALQSRLAPGSFLRPLHYELRRGFEFSSVPGTLNLLLTPAHLRFRYAFGNQQVAGPDGRVIGIVVTLLMVGALIAVWRLTGRGRMPVEATALAVLSVAVLTDKALAPQYLLWLAPLWSYWRLRPSWLVAMALTTLVTPLLSHSSLLPNTVVAAVRNAVLLGGSVAWLAQGLRTKWTGRAHDAAPVHEGMEVLPCSVAA